MGEQRVVLRWTRSRADEREEASTWTEEEGGVASEQREWCKMYEMRGRVSGCSDVLD